VFCIFVFVCLFVFVVVIVVIVVVVVVVVVVGVFFLFRNLINSTDLQEVTGQIPPDFRAISEAIYPFVSLYYEESNDTKFEKELKRVKKVLKI
jgi:hypothetical protein